MAQPKAWEQVELRHSSLLLTTDIAHQLAAHLPRRLQDKNWSLVYSTDKHGVSFGTCRRNMAKTPGPTVLVIKDTNGYIFGCFASEQWKQTAQQKYYGNGESFLFHLSPRPLSVYRWTEANDFIQVSQEGKESFALGGGDGGFGLWLDYDMKLGVSHRCATFGNAPLSSGEHFERLVLEVWGFDTIPAGRLTGRH